MINKKICAAVLAATMVFTTVLSSTFLPNSAVRATAATADVDITGGLGSANTGDEVVTGDFNITYSFKNASHDTSANWNNFAVEVSGEGFGITARADAFAVGFNGAETVLGGWGDNPIPAATTWTGQPEDWAAWAAGMADADVEVNVKRTGNVLTFTYKMNAGGQDYTFVGVTPEVPNMPEVLNIHLTGEKVALSNVKFIENAEPSIDEPDTSEPDTDNSSVEKPTESTSDNNVTKDVDITGGLGSANTGDETVVENFDVTYSFKNASHDTSANWNNFVVEVFGEGFGITARADAFAVGFNGAETVLGGWGDNPIPAATTWTGQPEDWAVWAAGMADADVEVNVKRTGNVLTFTYKMNAGGQNYTFVGVTPQVPNMPEVLNIHLTGEKVALSNVKFKNNKEPGTSEPDTSEPDTDNPSVEKPTESTSDNNVTKDVDITGGLGSANTGDETVVGSFDVTYSFKNASHDTSANWNNFTVEVFGEGFGITARADAFAVGFNGAETVLGGWGDNPIPAATTWTGFPENWAAWAAGMADADVEVNVKRTGNVLTFTYKINAGGQNYTFVGVTPQVPNMPEVLNIHLTGEKVALSNVKFKNNKEPDTSEPDTSEPDTSEPDTSEPDTSEPSTNTPDKNVSDIEYIGVKTNTKDAIITNAFSANTGDETVTGDFDVTYTFHNATTGTLNWHNFILEIFDGEGQFIDTRADAFGWTAGEWVCGGDAWTDDEGAKHMTFTRTPDEDNWAAWFEDMKNCDVTVNVKRAGNVFDITYDFNAASQTAYKFTTKVTLEGTVAETLNMHLTGEQVALTNVKFKDNNAGETSVVVKAVEPVTVGGKEINVNLSDNKGIIEKLLAEYGNLVFSVKNVTEGGAYEANLTELKKLSNFNKMEMFDLDFKGENGASITKLDGNIQVTLDIPATLDASKKLVVYREEADKTLTALTTSVAENKISFFTDHFSNYIIAELEGEGETTAPEETTTVAETTTAKNKKVNTGDSAPVTIFVLLAVSAGAAIIVSKKKVAK